MRPRARLYTRDAEFPLAPQFKKEDPTKPPGPKIEGRAFESVAGLYIRETNLPVGAARRSSGTGKQQA